MIRRTVFTTLAMGMSAACALAAPSPRLANPASELCIKNGATIVMENAESGAQRGVCVFPDGTRIPEWTYFRNKNRLSK